MTTLMALEAVNKLKEFAGVFDIETYRKYSFRGKCERVLESFFLLDNDPGLVRFLRVHGIKLPSKITAYVYLFPRKFGRLMKRVLKKVLGIKPLV